MWASFIFMLVLYNCLIYITLIDTDLLLGPLWYLGKFIYLNFNPLYLSGLYTYVYLPLFYLWIQSSIDCLIIYFIISTLVLFKIWLYSFSFFFSWSFTLWTLANTLCTTIGARPHVCWVLNFLLTPTTIYVVLGLHILPCVGSVVWRQGPVLLIGCNWVGFLPEDTDRVQSPKHCYK
jgi:hypothetical protein